MSLRSLVYYDMTLTASLEFVLSLLAVFLVITYGQRGYALSFRAPELSWETRRAGIHWNKDIINVAFEPKRSASCTGCLLHYEVYSVFHFNIDVAFNVEKYLHYVVSEIDKLFPFREWSRITRIRVRTLKQLWNFWVFDSTYTCKFEIPPSE